MYPSQINVNATGENNRGGRIMEGQYQYNHNITAKSRTNLKTSPDKTIFYP